LNHDDDKWQFAPFFILLESKKKLLRRRPALTHDMQLIKEDFSIDFAFRLIGNNFTMEYW